METIHHSSLEEIYFERCRRFLFKSQFANDSNLSHVTQLKYDALHTEKILENNSLEPPPFN